MNNFDFSSVYDLERAGYSRESARVLKGMVEANMQLEAVYRINQLLIEVDVQQLGVHALIELVRTPVSLKPQLPSWQTTYEKCWRRVKQLGHQPEKLFVNLQVLDWLDRE